MSELNPGDVVQVTIYAKVKEPFIGGGGYHLDVHGVSLAVQEAQIQRVIAPQDLSEIAQRILHELYETKGGYMAGWTLGERLGQAASTIEAAAVLYGNEWTQNPYERAMRELVDRGLVEEMPELGERWRLVVKESKDEREDWTANVH